ncbi:MAG: hypothetical protein ACYC7J_18580 [Syntrophales bacterium]
MKRVLGWLVVLGMGSFVVLGCAGLSGDVMKPGPAFVVTTPVVQMSPDAKVLMYGTGFAPKQEVTLLFKDAGGGLSGISGAVKPAPIPNAEGAWAAEWDVKAYLKLIKPGTAMITVVDKDYKPVTQAPVLFIAAPKKAEAKKK